MGTLSRAAQALFCLAISSSALATEPAVPEGLYHDPVWLNLVHYQPDTFGSGYTSEADDPAFFLSPDGKHSPRAELNATLAAIQASGGGDESARCRFPARDAWLRRQLDLPADPAPCPAYDTWRRDLNTQTVTLVFAASYLNSPSSMFGHTFLRLDPPGNDQNTNLLLASTISYAADAGARDNELMFAYRGIFGGYPGVTSVEPYYDKVKLYSDIENRDLWEYTLNLTPDEVDRLLAHAWELRDKNFDYYFFDENCAYRLLALIDVARPGTRLLDNVTTHAIPSDTVRWVVDKGLVSHVRYRPSASTTVAYELDHLTDDQQAIASAVADGYVKPDGQELASLPTTARAHVLDATYDYVRYQSTEEKWPRELAAPLSRQLLVARSHIDGVKPVPKPPAPPVRDDQGHDTFRVSLAGGQQDHRGFSQLTVRPAYHDLLDPPEGYRPGAQLQFLRLDARLYTNNDELQLENLTAVEIRSLSPRDGFFSPLSWQVGVGARRTDTGEKRVLAPYLDGGVGGSWMLGAGVQAFTLATADAEVDNDLNRGFDLAPGADLGLLYQSPRVSLMGGARSKAWMVSEQHRQDTLYLKASWHLSRDISLFGEFNREHHYERYQSEWQAGLSLYF
ncbi:Lnb N-terminal periplasmic domain-containing protein [Marinobacter sp. C2H3]|uniref:Lnb N-terminal periplasmic domain-containing protein n=1 Tax=Marinobacter sp. C2H3 TaxID=3119003 RepID=UPI00300EA87D